MLSLIKRIESRNIPVLTHSEWGARYESLYLARRTGTYKVTLPVPYLYQHITVTNNTGSTVNSFKTDMQTLERIGYERFQSGISYNWAVDGVTGMIGEGQYLDAKGTHTVNDKAIPGFPNNLNYYGHAIAVIGMPGMIPSDVCMRSIAAIIEAEWFFDTAKLFCGYYPHSKFANKDCPTDPIRTRMPIIYKMAESMRNDSVAIDLTSPISFGTFIPAAPPDPDGSGVRVYESLLRGNHTYYEGPIEGSATDERLDALAARVKALEDAQPS